MNSAFPDILYNGILLCTGLYLIFLALINFLSKKIRLILLAVLCFLIGAIIVNNIFWPEVKNSLLLTLLVGSAKQIFIGPVVFLYSMALAGYENNLQKQIVKHLSVPFLIHIIFIVIKVVFREYYVNNYEIITKALHLTESLFLIIYFSKAATVLLKLMKHKRKSISVSRMAILFYMLMVYFTVGKLYTASSIYIESSFWADYFLEVNRYFFMPMAILVNGLLIAYTVIEMKWIKLLVFGKILPQIPQQDQQLDGLFEKYFLNEKIYTHQEMSMKYLSEMFEVPPHIIRSYLQNKYKVGFKDYLNRMRVDELKELMSKEESKMYSLEGMANKVGFNSPATFYRIFKRYTGMTPQQYLKKKEN